MTVTAIPGAISSTRYVNIISGVGANSVIPARQLIGRLFTDNGLLPPQSYKQFSSAAEVGAYFRSELQRISAGALLFHMGEQEHHPSQSHFLRAVGR